MSEIISTPRKDRPYELATHLRKRRDELFEVIVLVFLVSALVNLLTGIYVEQLNGAARWIVSSVASGVLLLLSILAYRRFAAAGGYEIIHQIILPLRNAPRLEFLESRHYKALSALRQIAAILNRSSKKREARAQQVIADWQRFQQSSFRVLKPEQHPALYDFLVDLVEFQILRAIRDFGERTLTANAVYSTQGFVRPTYPVVSLEMKDWPASFKENSLLQFLQKRAPQKLRLLAGFHLQHIPLMGRKKAGPAQIVLTSKAGEIRFTINPYIGWMPIDSRDRLTISRYCGLPPEEVILFKVSFLLSVQFGGWRAIRKSFTATVLPWLEDMVEAIEQSLDWNYCLQFDAERLLIEMREKSNGNPQNKPASASRVASMASLISSGEL